MNFKGKYLERRKCDSVLPKQVLKTTINGRGCAWPKIPLNCRQNFPNIGQCFNILYHASYLLLFESAPDTLPILDLTVYG